MLTHTVLLELADGGWSEEALVVELRQTPVADLSMSPSLEHAHATWNLLQTSKWAPSYRVAAAHATQHATHGVSTAVQVNP